MKKLIAGLAVCALLVSFCACQENSGPSDSSANLSTDSDRATETSSVEQRTWKEVIFSEDGTTISETDSSSSEETSDAPTDQPVSETEKTTDRTTDRTSGNTKTSSVTDTTTDKTDSVSSATSTGKPGTDKVDLKPLAETEYYGYRQIKSSAVKVKLYQMLSAGLNEAKTEITIPAADGVSKEAFTEVYNLWLVDHPQAFWVEGGYSYKSSGNTVISVTPKYLVSGATLTSAKATFNRKAATYLNLVDGSMGEYEIELAFHDALVKNTAYQNGTYAHSAYGAFVEGKAVCDGYSKAFQYLLNQAGIQAIVLTGSSPSPGSSTPESHAWNCVRINGNWYMTDVTWDNDESSGSEPFHGYFNLTSAQIKQDHTLSGNAVTVPNCTATAENYHVKNGTNLGSSYSVDTIVRALKTEGKGYTGAFRVPNVSLFLTWVEDNALAIGSKLKLNGFRYGWIVSGSEVILTFSK